MKIFRTGAYANFYDFPLTVDWLLTQRCNYHCSYCFDRGGILNKQSSQKPFSTLEQLKTAVNNIASLNRPWYNISIAGGEPTIHPHFFDLINLLYETFKDRLDAVSITSNGSRERKFFEKLLDLTKLVNIKLTISIHTEHADINHILELLEALAGKGIYLKFSLMFNPDRREEVHLIYDILFEYRKRFPFTIDITLLRDDNNIDSRHTQNDVVWQKESTLRFNALEKVLSSKVPHLKKWKHSLPVFHDIEYNGERKVIEISGYNKCRMFNYTNDLLNFNGMYCIAHAAVLSVMENGFCRGMVCGADPIICNLFEENSLKAVQDNLIHIIQCPLKLCGCGHNDLIPKFSSLEEATRFVEVVNAKQKVLLNEYNAAHLIKKI